MRRTVTCSVPDGGSLYSLSVIGSPASHCIDCAFRLDG